MKDFERKQIHCQADKEFKGWYPKSEYAGMSFSQFCNISETFNEKYDRLTEEAKQRMDKFIFGSEADRLFEIFNKTGVWYVDAQLDADKRFNEQVSKLMGIKN